MATKIISDVYSLEGDPWTFHVRAECSCTVAEAEPTPAGMLAEVEVEIPVRLRVRYRVDAAGRVEIVSAEEG